MFCRANTSITRCDGYVYVDTYPYVCSQSVNNLLSYGGVNWYDDCLALLANAETS